MKSNCAGMQLQLYGNAATKLGEVISMCVESVQLRHCNYDKEMSTFALLDTCSQGTFVPDNLLKRLGLSRQNFNQHKNTNSNRRWYHHW